MKGDAVMKPVTNYIQTTKQIHPPSPNSAIPKHASPNTKNDLIPQKPFCWSSTLSMSPLNKIQSTMLTVLPEHNVRSVKSNHLKYSYFLK